MNTKKRKNSISKSAATGSFTTKGPKTIGPKGHTFHGGITKEKATLAERTVREFYKKHGDAMTTLAYE